MPAKTIYEEILPLDLAGAKHEYDVTESTGLAIVIAEAGGGWNTATFNVKIAGAGGAFDFSTPKTIPVGGGAVQISAAEMAGVSRIRIEQSASAEADRARAILTISSSNTDSAVPGEITKT